MTRSILSAKMEEVVVNPQKRKGDAFERDVIGYFRENGFIHAERAYGAGRPDDVGDVDGIPGIVLEIKNLREIRLGELVDEAQRERANAWAVYGIGIQKRRRRPVSDAYAVLPLSALVDLLLEAGYGAKEPDVA